MRSIDSFEQGGTRQEHREQVSEILEYDSILVEIKDKGSRGRDFVVRVSRGEENKHTSGGHLRF